MLVLLSIAVIMSIIFAICLIALSKRVSYQASQIVQLEQQLSGLCAAAVGSDERFVAFGKAVNQLKEQHNTLSLGPAAQQQGYEHAIRLARKGAAIDQIIDSCNLSDEEARLITRLHGLSNPASELH